MILPTKRPTPAEYSVLLFATSMLFVVLGVAGVAFGVSAPTEEQQSAQLAIHYGAVCIGLGPVIGCVWWLLRRFAANL